MTEIAIISVTHKQYWMPEDMAYLPVQVGNGPDFGYKRDNTGDNISNKNKNFCELTALYWAWKNVKADYIGLDHYRRHFASGRIGSKKNRVATQAYLDHFITRYDVILPRKRHYFIETNRSQYIHAHHKEDLDVLETVLKEKYPKIMPYYEKDMEKTSGHKFNMFIMKYDVLSSYCSFLFDVLFEVEKRLDISSYSAYDARVFGFLSERLLDVYIDWRDLSCKEISYVYMEHINWFKKGYMFLRRKVNGNNNEE